VVAFGAVRLGRPTGTVTGRVTQSWRARGGRTWLGLLLPAGIVAIAVVLLAGGVLAVAGLSPGGVRVFLFLLAAAALAAWLAGKVARTVWIVSRTVDDQLLCSASTRQWVLGPGQVLAVKGDAYGLFLVLVIADQKKIWLWGHMQDRAGLLSAVRRSSPLVDVDRYAATRPGRA
jgi:hypothetical protein